MAGGDGMALDGWSRAQLLGPNLLGQRGGNIGGSWDPHPFFHGFGFGFEKFGLKIIRSSTKIMHQNQGLGGRLYGGWD